MFRIHIYFWWQINNWFLCICVCLFVRITSMFVCMCQACFWLLGVSLCAYHIYVDLLGSLIFIFQIQISPLPLAMPAPFTPPIKIRSEALPPRSTVLWSDKSRSQMGESVWKLSDDFPNKAQNQYWRVFLIEWKPFQSINLKFLFPPFLHLQVK